MWPPAYFRVALYFIAAGWSVCDAVVLSREIEAMIFNTSESDSTAKLRPAKMRPAKLRPAQLVLAEPNSVSFFSEFGDMRGGEVLKQDPGSSILSRSAQQSWGHQQDPAPIQPKLGQTLAKVALAYGATKVLEKYDNSETAPEITMLNETEWQRDMAALGLENPFDRHIRRSVAAIVFGVLLVALAVSIQWFNEERSAKMNVLISRGLSDCEHVDANDLSTDHRGKLVHVQGKTRAAHPIVDDRFPDARVTGCLKLQSTVEVFEWSQTMRSYLDEKKERKTQARFHTEWSTEHKNSSRMFKKPSPDNPRLPTGLILGTTTKKCTRVELGAFALTDDMVTRFHKFEPALKYLPSKLVSHGLTFFANTSDGYYYSRPSESIPGGEPSPVPTLFTEPQVGDLRIRFLCVPEGEATVVAVQCEKEPDLESFVPYRPISRPPCLSEYQERMKLIEEGDRPLKDLRRQAACCTSCPGRCCCCVCNLVAFSCKEEIITEEIFYVSDSLEAREKPFECVVRRNPCRVWVFRVFGWGLLYVGIILLLLPFASQVQSAPGLAIYGRSAPFVLALITTLACSAFIMACTYAFYQPFVTFKWCCAVGVIIAAPLVYGTWG